MSLHGQYIGVHRLYDIRSLILPTGGGGGGGVPTPSLGINCETDPESDGGPVAVTSSSIRALLYLIF